MVREEDSLSVVGFFTPPIGKAGESEQIAAEIYVPRTCQLEVVGRLVFLNILIHSSQREAFGKGSIIKSVGAPAR